MKNYMTGRNLFIVDKEAELFDSVRNKDSMLSVMSAQKSVRELKKEEIHACLFSEELQNVTLIIRGERVFKVTMILEKEEEFQKLLTSLKAIFDQVEFSAQDKKINGYASAIVEKLQEGTVLTIIDKKVDTEVLFCPDCGVQYDPNIPYCMECGARVG